LGGEDGEGVMQRDRDRPRKHDRRDLQKLKRHRFMGRCQKSGTVSYLSWENMWPQRKMEGSNVPFTKKGGGAKHNIGEKKRE